MMTSVTDVQVPAGVPVLPGALLSGRYVLAGSPLLNKGDTLDALPLPDRRVGLLVADVVGSGLGAAVAVAQVRAVLRERLCAGVELLEAVRSLDRYARGRPELHAATVCAATLALDNGRFEWATTGHPPPLWLTPDEMPRFLPTPPTRPLGVGGHQTTHTTALERGDMVALYTDGLVSNGGSSLDEGRRRLLRATRDAWADPPDVPWEAQLGDVVCDRILRSALPVGGGVDDAALLVAIRSDIPEPFALELSAEPENLPRVRHLVNGWLDGLGAGLIDHVGLGHAVVELAANVIAHAYLDHSAAGDRPVRIDARLEPDGAVCVSVSDRGRWRDHSSTGRGLMMAAGLVDTMRVTRTDGGTRVELTQRLTRAVSLLQAVPDPAGRPLRDETEEFEATTEGARLIVSGPLDELSVEVFHAAMTEVTRAGTHDATVDLTGLTHLASPGVETIFEFIRRTARTGAGLTLVAPEGSRASQILHLVNLPVDG